jgi:hypothetical protein
LPQQKNVIPAKEMDLNQATLLTDAHIVEEMVKYDLIKGFLRFNKPVLNAMAMGKKLLTLVQTVTDKEKNKHQKKYL